MVNQFKSILSTVVKAQFRGSAHCHARCESRASGTWRRGNSGFRELEWTATLNGVQQEPGPWVASECLLHLCSCSFSFLLGSGAWEQMDFDLLPVTCSGTSGVETGRVCFTGSWFLQRMCSDIVGWVGRAWQDGMCSPFLKTNKKTKPKQTNKKTCVQFETPHTSKSDFIWR